MNPIVILWSSSTIFMTRRHNKNGSPAWVAALSLLFIAYYLDVVPQDPKMFEEGINDDK
jgi:hypothetical protein